MTRKVLIGFGTITAVLTLLMFLQPYRLTKHNGKGDLRIRYHRSVAEWINDPVIDYIIVGQVVSKGESRIIPDTITPAEIRKQIEQNGGLAGYIVTDYTFQVLHVVKGKDLNSGDTITIVKVGGSINGRIEETPLENPPLESGDQVILSLFLDPHDPTISSDNKKYTVITQPEVRYKILNGKLELMPGEWQNSPELIEFVRLKGLSEADFAQKALNALQADSTAP